MKSAAPHGVRVRALAKINLSLRILGVDAGGYHELRTIFQSLALHDTLSFEITRGPFVITSDDPHCPTDDTNLVWKAAARLWKEAGRRGHLRGLRVHITKRIPAQAGLGGGSSDAAAALRALRMLWNLDASDDEVAALARGLGADVAFFLEGGTALGLDRGDVLFPLQDTDPAWVVIARPPFGVSTKDAYAWWDAAQPSTGGRRGTSGIARRADRQQRHLRWMNDLEPVVARRHPAIAILIGRLKRAGARYAAMSGSGSAVFGLYEAQDAARRAAQALQGTGVTVLVTRTVGRRKYLRVSAPESGEN
jgi:4-diphosphocytidyl-2-C-methyl-D-erythritol kinase